MDKKKSFLKYDIEKIKEIEHLLLEISIPKEKDFEYLIKLINEIENNMFIIGNIVDIEYLSVIRKTFVYIEKYPEQYLFLTISFSLSAIFLLYNSNPPNFL